MSSAYLLQHDELYPPGRLVPILRDFGIPTKLVRLDKGVFGVCRECGEPIAEPRLNAIPWTRVCITCKEKQKA